MINNNTLNNSNKQIEEKTVTEENYKTEQNNSAGTIRPSSLRPRKSVNEAKSIRPLGVFPSKGLHRYN